MISQVVHIYAFGTGPRSLGGQAWLALAWGDFSLCSVHLYVCLCLYLVETHVALQQIRIEWHEEMVLIGKFPTFVASPSPAPTQSLVFHPVMVSRAW